MAGLDVMRIINGPTAADIDLRPWPDGAKHAQTAHVAAAYTHVYLLWLTLTECAGYQGCRRDSRHGRPAHHH